MSLAKILVVLALTCATVLSQESTTKEPTTTPKPTSANSTTEQEGCANITECDKCFEAKCKFVIYHTCVDSINVSFCVAVANETIIKNGCTNVTTANLTECPAVANSSVVPGPSDKSNASTDKPSDSPVKPTVTPPLNKETSTSKSSVAPIPTGEPEKSNDTATTTPTEHTVTPSSLPVIDATTTKKNNGDSDAPHVEGNNRHFDAASFVGGIVLAIGLLAIAFVGFKFYRARTEHNYHTLHSGVRMQDV